MTPRNNGKRRRLAKAAAKQRGNAGRPDPSGNREYRRSDAGRQAIAQILDKLRQAAA